MSGATELLCRCKACRTGTDNGDFLSAANLRQDRTNPAFKESALDDVLLVLFDRHRRLRDAQHARRLTRCRADAAGELGKIVSRMKLANCIFPTSTIDQIVPVGDEVVDRTPCLAERYAAIHAARALFAQLLFGKVLIDLEPVVHALEHWTARSRLAVIVHEAGCLTHVAPAL